MTKSAWWTRETYPGRTRRIRRRVTRAGRDTQTHPAIRNVHLSNGTQRGTQVPEETANYLTERRDAPGEEASLNVKRVQRFIRRFQQGEINVASGEPELQAIELGEGEVGPQIALQDLQGPGSHASDRAGPYRGKLQIVHDER